MTPKLRRHYRIGLCQDCGYTKRTTRIMFWLNGMKYRVCAQCIKPYRDRILRGSPEAMGYEVRA